MPNKIAREITRLCLMSVAVAAALVGVQAAARADCGMHAFTTVNVPILKQQEATPLEGAAIMRVNGSQATLASAGGPPPLQCPDESYARNTAAFGLESRWASAIQVRASQAALKIVMAGGSNVPSACLPIERTLMRALVARNYAAFSLQTPAVMAEMKKSPYYTHIDTLWTGIFANAGMTKPAPGTDLISWSMTIRNAANTAMEHLPTVPAPGCVDDPIIAAPKA